MLVRKGSPFRFRLSTDNEPRTTNHQPFMKTCLSIAFLWRPFCCGRNARACSCPSYPPAPVDDGFDSAEIVGIFKLLRREKDRPPKATSSSREAGVSVEKVYKGDLKPGGTMMFSEGECSLNFKTSARHRIPPLPGQV